MGVEEKTASTTEGTMRRFTASSKRSSTSPRAPRLVRPCSLCRALPALLTCLLALAGAASFPVAAQVAKQSNDSLSKLAFRSEELAPSQRIAPLDAYRPAAPSAAASAVASNWAAFSREHAGWQASVDQRTGLVASAEGPGIPWIPGRGNKLGPSDVSRFLKRSGGEADLSTLEGIARRELGRLSPLLAAGGQQLVLNQGRSGHPADHLWVVDFDLVRDGLVVEGAHVVFRVNNGNLIQFGSENLPAPGSPVPPTAKSRQQALAALSSYVGGLTARDKLLDSGSLHLLPANAVDASLAARFEPGRGRKIVKVWQFTFHRDGVQGTWRARVDAATGKLLDFVDVNQYATAQATGGIFPNSPTDPEVVRPMPYADLSGGANANSAGLFPFSGGVANSTLAGPFVKINGTCGGVSQGSDPAR